MYAKPKTYRVFATKNLISPAEFIMVVFSKADFDNQLEALSMAGYTEIITYKLGM